MSTVNVESLRGFVGGWLRALELLEAVVGEGGDEGLTLLGDEAEVGESDVDDAEVGAAEVAPAGAERARPGVVR